MYRVVIFEDELVIRRSLINQINWSDINCEIVGEADNGDDAISIIDKSFPDIVISDIKMDGRDGLALCKHIKEKGDEIKIILITGFAKIDYAQAAIKMNVNDFILKPIDPQEIITAVKKVIGELESEKNIQDEIEKLSDLAKTNIQFLKERFFLELANNMLIDNAEIIRQAKIIGIGLQLFSCAIFEIDNGLVPDNNGIGNPQPCFIGIKEIIKDIINENVSLISLGNNICVILEIHDLNKIFELIDLIQREVAENYNMTISVGISRVYDNICKLRQAIEEAQYALKHKFNLGNKSIIYIDDLKSPNVIGNINNNNQYFRLANTILTGDTKNSEAILNSLWKEISEYQDEDFIRSKAIELVIFIFNVLINDSSFNLVSIMPPLHDVYNKLNHCLTGEMINKYLRNLVVKVCNERYGQINKTNRGIIKKVLDYLSEHYNEDVRLETIAGKVFLNPKYLSTLIKKETGQTITDILTKIRIEKAMGLMKDYKLKTYEIALMVGFTDSRYFSQLFRKLTGLTPRKYRKTL